MTILRYVNDLVYGTIAVMDERLSLYDRSQGSCISKDKSESEGLCVMNTEDGEPYALPWDAYDYKNDLVHYSNIYEYKNRFFKYNYTDRLVSLMAKATEDIIKDDEEWKANHNGDSLFGIVDGYYKLDTVGLAKDNWDNIDLRNEYLSMFIEEHNEECRILAEDFAKYELNK